MFGESGITVRYLDAVLRKDTDENGNERWHIIRKLNPGDHVAFVRLEHKNGRPVLDTIHNVTEGVSFRREYDDVYSISVSPLVNVDSAGKKVTVKPEEYKHIPSFLPKKNNYCDIGSDHFTFSFRVNIPKRDVRGGGPHSTSGMDNQSSEIDPDAYQDMEECLFGIYTNGRLILNKSNMTIRQMASFNRDEHPSLYRRWQKIYELATKVARIAQIANREVVEVDFYKNNKSDSFAKWNNPEYFFVNSHLRIVFEGDEAQSLLRDVSATNHLVAA
jgi:hypothetical protein